MKFCVASFPSLFPVLPYPCQPAPVLALRIQLQLSVLLGFSEFQGQGTSLLDTLSCSRDAVVQAQV